MTGAKIVHKKPGALDSIVTKFKKATEKEIALGFPAGAAESYPDGTSVVEVAASHVFGVGVPQRDFMAFAKDGIRDKAEPILRQIASLGDGDEKGISALQEAAGQAGQSAIRAAITELREPPNSPATIAAKGSDNPLIDTTHMRDSVTYVVRKRTR
jgi:hypothetical protein